MAKLEYNDVTAKRTIILDDDPYVVLSSAIAKKDRQKASNSVKLKNLRTGNVIDRTFHQSEVLEEADIDKREVKYIYNKNGEWVFCPPDKPGERFSLPEETISDGKEFLKGNSIVNALVFDDEIISIQVPIKVELKVTEAAPAVKGNTTSGASKDVTVETGATVQVPQFINEGDILSINTETGEYSERIEKA